MGSRSEDFGSQSSRMKFSEVILIQFVTGGIRPLKVDTVNVGNNCHEKIYLIFNKVK